MDCHSLLKIESSFSNRWLLFIFPLNQWKREREKGKLSVGEETFKTICVFWNNRKHYKTVKDNSVYELTITEKHKNPISTILFRFRRLRKSKLNPFKQKSYSSLQFLSDFGFLFFFLTSLYVFCFFSCVFCVLADGDENNFCETNFH